MGNLKFQLEPEDHQRVQSLCGPTNLFLKQIEKTLQIKINNQGFNFKLSGNLDKLNIGKSVLLELYRNLLSSKELTSLEVHLQITEAMNTTNNDNTSEKKIAVHINTPKLVVIPKGDIQIDYVKSIQSKDITFGIGPAGTGKTYLAIASAVEQLSSGQVQRIMLVRPAVEAGEKLGFLPGDLSQKIDPYLRPLYDALFEMLGFVEVSQMIDKNIIETVPLAFMRGRTLDNSFIILDESQNATKEQMKMFLTRFGFGSKSVITGDITQIDLPSNSQSGLIHAQKILKYLDEEIGFVHFSKNDVVRHGLVKNIVQAYEDEETKLI